MNNENENYSTLSALLHLLKSFLYNSSDYLIIFIPLLILYKICIRKKEHIYSHRTKLNQFLRLFSFGTGKDLEGDDAESLLPTSKNDLMVEKIEKDETNETRNTILKFLLCFFGLQISFLLWGIMQERIIKYSYKDINLDGLSHEDILMKRKKMNNFKY